MTQYHPLTMARLEEGRVMERVDRAFEEVRKDLLKFAEQHGQQANGAKASFTLKVTVAAHDAAAGIYTTSVAVTTKGPAHPATTSTALARNGDLFCQAPGSDAGDPRQTRLDLDTGDEIDTNTGEVLPRHGKDIG